MDVAPLSNHDRIQHAINKLPTIPPEQVPLEESCPICLLTFKTILHGDGPEPQESNIDGQLDVGAIFVDALGPEEERAVTKVDACGHLFCKRDLVEWITNLHGTCPACRYIFLDIKPVSDTDDESSDGGEYIPADVDEDDVDDFWDEHDGFSSDIEFDVAELDLEAEMDLDDIYCARDGDGEAGTETDADYESEAMTTDHEEA